CATCCVLLRLSLCVIVFFFFLNDRATTEIYTLSLHDALPISRPGCLSVGPARTCARRCPGLGRPVAPRRDGLATPPPRRRASRRSEEHTSELQSRENLVCRLLLEKKKKKQRKKQTLKLQTQKE